MTEERCPFHPDAPLESERRALMCRQKDWIHYFIEDNKLTYEYIDAKNEVSVYYYPWSEGGYCSIYTEKYGWVCNKPIRSLEHFIEYCKGRNYMTLILLA